MDKQQTQYLLKPMWKMEVAHKLLKIPKSECPDIWILLPRHKWPKSWSCMEDPVVPLERNLYGHPLAGLMVKTIWENHNEVRLGDGFHLGIPFRTPSKWVILICVCGWHENWLERNKILIRCGKYSTKKLICENQHLSWIMFFLGCTNDNAW